MLAEDRYRKIKELLKKDGSVRVTVLTELFGVSTETVRRDLEYLEKEGVLRRVHGGAIQDIIDTHEFRFQDRTRLYQKNKLEIAELACRFVEEESSVALDVSTTNLEIARLLKQRFHRLTILTNSLDIASELTDAENFTVILTGGILHHSERSLVGDTCNSHIRQYHVNTCFISASGISLNSGITDVGFGEVGAKKQMIDIAQKVIVVCNHSRFDIVSLLKVCDLMRIDCILTDSGLSREVMERYTEAGVNVLVPESGGERQEDI